MTPTRCASVEASSKSWVTSTVGSPSVLEQLAQFGADARPRVRVERGERLVQQEDLRIACERSRERDALALSARELP